VNSITVGIAESMTYRGCTLVFEVYLDLRVFLSELRQRCFMLRTDCDAEAHVPEPTIIIRVCSLLQRLQTYAVLGFDHDLTRK